jgi:glutaredoxin 3
VSNLEDVTVSGDPQIMTSEKVLIFGKDSCPYTQAARDDYARRKVPFEYVNVKKNPTDLQRMLEFSRGRREVPVIVEAGRVTVGFGGT